MSQKIFVFKEYIYIKTCVASSEKIFKKNPLENIMYYNIKNDFYISDNMLNS